MDLKKIDLDKLQDYAFTPYELAMVEMASDQKFINIKCLDNDSIVPTVKAIPIDKVKQFRAKIEDIGIGSYLEVTGEIECNGREVRLSKKFATVILDKLITESEEE